MDREAAVIRAQMSKTRIDLDQKIDRLEARARELTPRQMARRYMPDYPMDRAIGAMLTLAGSGMAWWMWRNRFGRRARIRTAMMTYGRW
jgi:hypothetical protein